MTIGIASPISAGGFDKFIYDEYKDLSRELSTDFAPAVTTLAREFLLAGHKLVIFTLEPKARQELILKGDSLTIYVAPLQSPTKIKRLIDTFSGRNIRSICKLFKKNNSELDVMSVHWTREYALASRRFLNKIPVFVTIRDIIPYIVKTQKFNWRNYKWGLIYLMNECVMHNSHFNFIANSQYTANSVKKYWKKSVPVISNPILDKYFNIKYTPKDYRNIFNIITISISQPDDKRKNVETLLNAFKIVHNKFPNTSLSLIGPSFHQQHPIIKEWEKKELLNGVQLMGATDHDKVLNILSHSNLMVHPSLEETFGNTLIEAMAVGCPVIGGINSGAVPFVLDNGHAGYLCDVTSSNLLSDTIIQVITNPKERLQKSIYAKKYCYDNFSSKNIANKYLKLFENILNK